MLTLIFWIIDKRKIRLHLTGKPVYNIALGCVTGAIWLGVSIGILSIIGVVHIDGQKSNIDAMVVDDFGFSQYDYARNVSSWLFISDDKK